jgi:hypothetical protein
MQKHSTVAEPSVNKTQTIGLLTFLFNLIKQLLNIISRFNVLIAIFCNNLLQENAFNTFLPNCIDKNAQLHKIPLLIDMYFNTIYSNIIIYRRKVDILLSERRRGNNTYIQYKISRDHRRLGYC